MPCKGYLRRGNINNRLRKDFTACYYLVWQKQMEIYFKECVKEFKQNGPVRKK